MKHTPRFAQSVSRETRDRLQVYADLLLKWNPTINLISRKDEAELWPRHIEDALQLLSLIPAGTARFVDLGSGGGLPGLVIAIAADLRVELIESDTRKATFLREAARLTGVVAAVHPRRIEHVAIAPASMVTARALAPLPALLGLAAPFIAPGGVLIAPKGRNVEAELTAARSEWHMTVTRTQSVTDPTATILQLREVTRVGQHH